MTIQELQEKRAKLLHDAQALSQKLLQKDITEEDRASTRSTFDSIMADVNATEGDIERVKMLETRSVPVPRATPGESVGSDNRTPEQRRRDLNASLRSWLQTGHTETRDLTVAGNGILIPTAVAEPNLALKFAGAAYDVVKKVRSANGEPLNQPLINATASNWVLNSTAISTTDPVIDGVTINVDDLRMNPILIDRSMLQDSSYDLASFVSEAAMTTYFLTVNNFITNGNSSKVQGLNTIAYTVQTAAVGTITYLDLLKLINGLDAAYEPNACLMMNKNTLYYLLGIVDGANRPLFLQYVTGTQDGFNGKLLGYNVKINPYMDDVATGKNPIMFGDFKAGYTFREVDPGIVISRLNDRYGDLLKVGFVGSARIGGALTDAGTHPIHVLGVK